MMPALDWLRLSVELVCERCPIWLLTLLTELSQCASKLRLMSEGDRDRVRDGIASAA